MSKLVFLLLLLPGLMNAQKLKPASYYISSPKVSKEAKKFYKNLPVYQKDKRKYYDDTATERLTVSVLDSMLTANKDTRPFYFYLVNKNSQLMDGSIQLAQAIRQYELLLKSPAYFFQFMIDNPTEQKKYMKGWYKNIRIYMVQASVCQTDFGGEEDRCKKDYQDKVMLALENADQKVKDLAGVFFQNN